MSYYVESLKFGIAVGKIRTVTDIHLYIQSLEDLSESL